ncbi:bifunctional diaminohydroxyphosphoribosylaminopyrimidine deaminase/5-amino-6-(5-phosphoribosylamino)uracil reductase RibD [Rufibacter sediminis]|uniref:Riboflavin biosynthesis protein RibD n=1 Tax=Rufibacter sediminis TaxID=2762756 RepID=A0ABR6VR34_9BACT|nr:bifunctional diaminohydroxyphosphoribosylaminopyrimidine deaminase/5-amino-6-(5-phosphoribosylamino)uracil reductase RibD [Rufibacter sediminis]MBC3539660.1 bifunctional diaminohydroxyphosphoribosylaminopyrimidine deaminase/5-amino-6-(5-phosphoribosylamino)uracil reductase RibD [Rufibacter sediminis]
MSSDEKYMRRALDLAALGTGWARPNPVVGCVVVHEHTIIGEGWHQQYGGPHAEVNALNSVKDKSLLPHSRVYVTLEPCSHYGKTPPCADFLIQHGVRDVVICNTDPNPLVAGRGIRKLVDAGCKVHIGVLEAEGLELNRRFFTFQTQKRPYLVLKWAESADGFIALPNCQPCQISGPLAKQLVHKWRTQEQAILVGTRTALHDNPQLNVRHWPGLAPLRIAIDKQLSIPATHHLLDDSTPTLLYTLQEKAATAQTEFVTLSPDAHFLNQLLADLYKRNVQSVLVEGGTVLLEALLEANLWDEIRVLKSPVTLTQGVKAPQLPAMPFAARTNIGEDEITFYRNTSPLL